MADYSRLDTSVSTIQNVIDDIKSFVETTPTGPAWVEDATYTAAGNAGELFLKTGGGTVAYLYFSTVSVASVSVLQAWWVPSLSNGYGGAAGPTGHKTVSGAFFYLDTAKYDYTQSLYADNDRLVAVLKGTLKAGAVPDAGDSSVLYQVLYLGLYTPHCASADDTYPMLVSGNAGPLLLTADASVTEPGFFPESLIKTVGPNDVMLAAAKPAGATWQPRYDASFVPVKNSRGTEAFATRQGMLVRLSGSEESLALIGLYLSTKDHGFDATVSIGGANHRSFPALLKTLPSDSSTSGAVYLAPQGTAI